MISKLIKRNIIPLLLVVFLNVALLGLENDFKLIHKIALNITLVLFFGLWFSIFYNLYRIEKLPVKKIKIRNLTNQERQNSQEIINKSANAKQWILISVIITIISIYFFILGLVSSNQFKFSNAGAIIAWLLLLIIVLGIIVFINNLIKFDRIKAHHEKIKKGLIRIEGHLYKINLSYGFRPTLKAKSIRMGKYNFETNTQRLKSIYDKLNNGDMYFIEYYPGTKEIINIGKLKSEISF